MAKPGDYTHCADHPIVKALTNWAEVGYTLGGDCAGMLRNLALGLDPERAMEIIGDLIEQKPKTFWQESIRD